MNLKLEIKYKGVSQSTISNLEKDVVNIGRAEGDFNIDDIKCSRYHALICVRDQDRLILYDLGSRNGTFVNDIRISAQEVFVGDEIRVGSTLIRILSNERYPDLRPFNENEDVEFQL